MIKLYTLIYVLLFLITFILYLIQQIYSKLNDADSLKGIIAVHDNDPSPQEMILLHEVNGQLQVISSFL